MIVYNKNLAHIRKCNIPLSIVKDDRRRPSVVKIKTITEDNRKFLKDLGFKLGNVTNYRPPISR